jgi:protein involved in polysaccharide export with SLBB domain
LPSGQFSDGSQPSERPKPPPTDFQKFAATSVGALLPIFGQSLFESPPSSFGQVDDLAPPDDYLLGPGDELRVRAWGQVEIDVRAVVSREGTISVPRVGMIPVAGTRYRDLTASVRAAVGRLYKGFDLSVSLGRLRSIQVFVVGQVTRPGLHTVSSLSTTLNALFASGGPSPTGTMRRIELRRGDKLVGKVDLYDLLLKGDKSKDLRLQSGDVIFVPAVGPVAAIAGRVKAPAIYELASAETPVSELIEYAGGPSTTADLHSIQFERLDQDKGRLVRELPWAPASLATTLRDGDVVQLRALSQRFDNAVTLRGNVAFPIRTEWKPGLTVSGLIPDRRVLIPETYWERTAARATFDPHAQVSTRVDGPRMPDGNRKQDGSRDLDAEDHPKTGVANLLDEVNWDYAVIERLDRARLEPRLIPFDLRKAVIDRDPASDLPLEPGDIVTVFSQNDVLSPSERRTYFVRIEGEVNVPGFYQVRPGDTLRQLVGRAGGFSKNAYLFGAEFTRERVRKEQQGKLDEVARRAEGELEHSGVERLSRATTAEEATATRTQLEGQRATIARLRSLKSSGRMVLELEPEASSVDQLPDLALEDGDRLFVPNRYSTVGVYGAVYNPTSLIYRPGKKLGDYLVQAGGTTRAADSGSAYVLRADGSVYSRRHAGFFSSFDGKVLMPNDAIVVPEDYAPVSWVKELKDWSQIFYQFGLGVAAIRILR